MQQYHEAEPNQPTEEAKREKGTAQIAQEGDGFVFEASAEQ
ncbi:hypothetical protein PSEEN4655 [Pseudomonas entomophila L48]|uniref:Uncharacterized protein n=2 Tax=Pseudomonas entomophila TaxID=312306 RepID=Q1I4W0_PSEE4|nr:hypothetical protein PSEEN4655 [Pseudomonas entomophila L48]